MARWAFAYGFECAFSRVRDMALMIRTVGVHTIPAGGKSDGRAYASLAEPFRELLGVYCRCARRAALVIAGTEATMAELPLLILARLQGSVAHKHTEARFECRHVGLAVVRRDVIDCDAAVATEPYVGELGDALVGTVASTEVQDGGPVVGEVLGERAAGAGRVLDKVVCGRVHVGRERVAAHDLVHMRRADNAWVDERVEALDDELRAAEADHGLRNALLGHEAQHHDLGEHFELRRSKSS